jgi:hypothetical protein
MAKTTFHLSTVNDGSWGNSGGVRDAVVSLSSSEVALLVDALLHYYPVAKDPYEVEHLSSKLILLGTPREIAAEGRSNQ